MGNTDADNRSPHLSRKRLELRTSHELIGICRGILADGEINQSEAEYLVEWMNANAEHINTWPFADLYARIQEMLCDGVLDHDEQRELLDTLSQIANPVLQPDGVAAPNESLCDDPVPDLYVHGATICLTGQFVADKRKNVETAVRAAGGRIASSVSKQVDFLVIGAAGSRDWLESTHGTKILAAADLKKNGHTIGVIAERYFMPLIND